MKSLTRGLIPIVFLLMALLLSTADAQQGVSDSIPDFNAAECREFRRRLLNHTLLSAHDRAHATKLGIAGASLFWTGLPALPLGISALTLGIRQSTPAIRELLLSGVTNENFEEINRLCAILVKARAVMDANLDGRNETAIILGSCATALGSLVLFMQIFSGLFTYWKVKASDEDDTESMISDAESMIKKRLSLKCCDDENAKEDVEQGEQDDDSEESTVVSSSRWCGLR